VGELESIIPAMSFAIDDWQVKINFGTLMFINIESYVAKLLMAGQLTTIRRGHFSSTMQKG
jgi:hypothetical protein